MFTGLVACVGNINRIARQGRDMELHILAPFECGSVKPGDSVAVNGVCLTAEKVQEAGKIVYFSAYVSAETLENSNLGNLKPKGLVNLELALALGERLGGHIVSGHADGIATVETVEEVASSHRVTFACAKELDIYIVNKGSVCVDGISLTVNNCAPGRFELNIIPETWNSTTANLWRKGYQANLEVDMLGKYVAKMLRLEKEPQAAAPARTGLGLDFFIKNGFN